MSISVSVGTGQTESGTAITPLALAPAAYRASVNDPGLTLLQNVSNALDQPNTVRYSVTDVADVFKGTGVDPIEGQRTVGKSVLVQVTETLKVTDSEGVLPTRYLPLSVHMVLKFPVDDQISGTILQAAIARLVGAIDRGTFGVDDVLSALAHGVTDLPAYASA